MTKRVRVTWNPANPVVIISPFSESLASSGRWAQCGPAGFVLGNKKMHTWLDR